MFPPAPKSARKSGINNAFRGFPTTTRSLWILILCRTAVTLAVLSRSGSWSASAFSTTPGRGLTVPPHTTRRNYASRGTVVSSWSPPTTPSSVKSATAQYASILGHDSNNNNSNNNHHRKGNRSPPGSQRTMLFDHFSRFRRSTTTTTTTWLKKRPSSNSRATDSPPSSTTATRQTGDSTTASATTTTTTTTTDLPPISKIDIGTFGIHFCAAVTMTLPVMMVPMMDVELAATAGSALASSAGGTVAAAVSLAATMASLAPLGNGMGKLVNGVVCQALGGKRSSKLYFVGSTVFSAMLASLTLVSTGSSRGLLSSLLTPQYLGLMVAGIEFCASIQWTVCSLFLSQYHRYNPAAFARGITILSLSSTGGQISAKVLGAILLQYVHWRWVARISVLVALLGWQISTWTSRNMEPTWNDERSATKTAATRETTVARMATNTTEIVQAAPVMKATAPNKNTDATQVTAAPNLRQSVGRVLGSKIFWMIGLAHVSGYLTRTSDRILGTFLQEVTSLSPQVCGGLTAFMTVGFLLGLVRTSSKFHQSPANDIKPKLALLRNGYVRYLFSAGGLIASAAFGKQWHPYLSAGIITVCASVMASSIAFPFFQVPNMVSSVYFGEVKPIALSLIDGTGVILTAPIWRLFTGILLPRFGWTFSWSMVALMVGLCGSILLQSMPTVLKMQQEQNIEQKM